MAKLLATFATAHALSPSFVERSPPPASALPPARPFDWSGGAEPATTGADAAAWPAVSVTVITRARPAFLAHALANLAAQDYPRSRLEVLVVDDTPGRAGPAAWDALRRAAPAAVSELGGCLRYLHGGGARRARLGAKRNAAVGAARGELVVVADDDDYYAPSRLRAQAAPLARGDADVVLLSAERAGLQFYFDVAAGGFAAVAGSPLVQPCSMAFRRDLWSGEDDGDGGGARLTAVDGARARADAPTKRQRRRAEAAGLLGAPARYPPGADAFEDIAFFEALLERRAVVTTAEAPWVRVRHRANVVSDMRAAGGGARECCV